VGAHRSSATYDQIIMELLRHELKLEHVARFQGLDSACADAA
jgi:hypothetical protein